MIFDILHCEAVWKPINVSSLLMDQSQAKRADAWQPMRQDSTRNGIYDALEKEIISSKSLPFVSAQNVVKFNSSVFQERDEL